MSQSFEFDSRLLPPDQAFEAYRRLYAGGSDVEQVGPFEARVRSLSLDGLVLFERYIDGVSHSRTARAGRDQFRHFALHLVRDGELRGSSESGFEVARAGDLVVADTRRRSRTEAFRLHVLSASIPRGALISASGGSDRLHGLVASAPHTAVLDDFMGSCLRHGDAIQPERRAALISAFVEVLATTLGRDPGSAVATDRRRTEMLQREAAVRYIKANLADRNLNAEAIAGAIGMSRRSLYRVFEQSGGVAQVIMDARLDAVRDALEDGSREPLTALAATYGFSDESHLSRRFRSANGESISEFRKRVSADGPADRGSRQLEGWVRSVR
ncbi:helix-turn-helix domain-containing protein [Brevundimonas sp.]|uniref:helix-turn-helix domain-containing protein n=1 Tax=Brevundimonas sp. TaxID=1871086 RepID=UPI0035B49A73